MAAGGVVFRSALLYSTVFDRHCLIYTEAKTTIIIMMTTMMIMTMSTHVESGSECKKKKSDFHAFILTFVRMG